MATPTHLVADILDKQIVDAKKTKCGKVDGLVLVLRDGKPPRVAYIEVGNAVLLRRFTKFFDRFKLSRYRIPWSKVKEVDVDVALDFDASDAPLLADERWLSEHIVGKVPFGR